MIELKIDNQVIETQEGETVMEAALRHGIHIPHLCYHPCLSIAGNCRICLVQVNGRPKLMPACNLPITPGMEIETDSEPVRAARRAVMQFITLNHPVDCGICDKAGECRLQEYQMKYGADDPFNIDPKHHKPKFYDLSDRIVYDGERCILCSRCVRFTREVSGTFQLGIVERGSHSRVERLEDRTFDDPYSDNVTAICPVGALLSRDFLYKSRVWYLEPVRSVCPGCARGCSINVWKRNHHWRLRSLGEEKNRMVYRVTPCDNPEINGPWICNKGFDLPKQLMKRPRVLRPQVNGASVPMDEILTEARRLVSQAQNPAIIVSAWASNEELASCKQHLGDRFTVYTRTDTVPAAGEIVEDQILIKADKNPNSRGVEALFGQKAYSAAGHDLVIVWGEGVKLSDLGSAAVIQLSSFDEPREKQPEILIPVSTFLERNGSFTNFEGKVNCFDKVFEKPELVQHAGELFGRLA
jgi:NADH-quinone oxidoreductase subunit G